MTGIASRIIHSGRFGGLDERVHDLQPLDRALLLLTLRRLDRVAEEVRLRVRDRGRGAGRGSTPHPCRRGSRSPKPYGEPKRSFSSRNSCSSLTTIFGSRSRKSCHVCSRRRTESTAASRVSSRRDSMSRYISRTFSAHWMRLSRSSFWIFPSVRRQRSFVSSRMSWPSSQRVDRVLQEAVAEAARLLQVLRVDAGDELRVLLVDLGAVEERVDDAVDVLRDRTLLRTGRLRRAPSRPGAIAARICSAATATCSSSRGVSLRSSRIAALRTSSRIFFASSVVICGTSSRKSPPTSLRASSSVGSTCSSAQVASPRVQKSSSSSKPFSALDREERTAAREALLEVGELLVAVDVDALGLGLDLVLEVVQVLRARLVVDRGDDRRREVEDLLELARSDVEQVPDAARDALEEPDVRDGRGQVDVTHALAAHLLPRHLDAAALADDALVPDALVLAAVALPVLRRTEDALAEQAVALRLQGAVVDRLRLRDLARRPVADLLRRRETNADRVELVDVDQVANRLFL